VNAVELTTYLHDVIPLSAAMGATVIEVAHGRVVIGAPLEPNRNHRGTVFGGSLSTLAVLAGFSVVLLGLREKGLPHRVVIQRNEYDYLLPADGPFEAVATIEARRWRRFVETLERRDRARITIDADVSDSTGLVGRLKGVFAALG
jgi:thioesterase domain-containing protein